MKTSKIIIKNRFRKDLGDLEDLKNSIREIGLLHPVVVNEDNELIAGQRRLESCKQLGWTEIPVTVVNIQDLARGEHDENVIRKDFTPSEAVAIWQAMKKINPPGKKRSDSERISKTRVKRAAKAVGMSTDTLSKAKQVVNSKDKKLIEEMDKTGNVNKAYQGLKKKEKEKEIIALKEKKIVLPKGKYHCIVVDPPWEMTFINRDVRPKQTRIDYPTMSVEEIKNFKDIINKLAYDNCHLYLWTTHKYLPYSFEIVKEWGFKYQCLMTWVKNVGITPFSWMYSTEHVLFCTKGSLPLLKRGERLDFSAKVREHSRKPDEFYEKVKLVSPAPRIDIFSREKRKGFSQYGNEVNKYE